MKTETGEWNALRADWRAETPADEALGARLYQSLRWRIWASRTWFTSEMISFALLALKRTTAGAPASGAAYLAASRCPDGTARSIG